MDTEPLLKRRKEESKTVDTPCVICRADCEEKQKNPASLHWTNFKEIALQWKLYDEKYKDVHDAIDWNAGPIAGSDNIADAADGVRMQLSLLQAACNSMQKK